MGLELFANSQLAAMRSLVVTQVFYVLLAVFELAHTYETLPIRRSVPMQESGGALLTSSASHYGGSNSAHGAASQNVAQVMARVRDLAGVVAELTSKLQTAEEKLERAEAENAEFVHIRGQVQEMKKGLDELQEYSNPIAINNVPEPQ